MFVAPRPYLKANNIGPRMRLNQFLPLYLNLSLLILFPVSWFAPLVRAGLLPIFGLSEISVMSGIASLWRTDIALALVVALFALIAPMAKTIALVMIQTGRAPDK
mgnify:CR=1 FL=1